MRFSIRTLSAAFILCLCINLYGARLEKVTVHSQSMNRDITTNVIVPETGERHSALYLLHGWGSDCDKWPRMKPQLLQRADSLNLLIVMPSGHNSWYWDSPVDSTLRFETFISRELVEYTDSHYPTVADRNHRVICGLSMGGQGALWNAVNHPDVFCAVGSMSGGVDITFNPEKWNIKDTLGSIEDNRSTWEAFRLPNRIGKIKESGLGIIITCGTEDFFFDVNKKLHEDMVTAQIPHHFIASPGDHGNRYWAEMIDYHLLFFRNILKRN